MIFERFYKQSYISHFETYSSYINLQPVTYDILETKHEFLANEFFQ